MFSTANRNFCRSPSRSELTWLEQEIAPSVISGLALNDLRGLSTDLVLRSQ